MPDERELMPGERFVAVAVADFPFAHGPFRCPHNERFCELAATCVKVPGGVVGAQWHATLTTNDFEACEYHDADWLSVAIASVAVLKDAGPTATSDDLAEACDRQELPESELCWLASLFEEPIHWYPGSPSVTNGQHRLCALRAAGAEFVAAETSG